MPRITPSLWFDTEGEEAASSTLAVPELPITPLPTTARPVPRPAGSVMTVTSSSTASAFAALNGGPQFSFSEADLLPVNCADQDEVDYYWDRLTAGGEESPCGWLKDRYGVSWQVVPSALITLLPGPRPGAVAAGDGGHDDDEEDRHRRRARGRRPGLTWADPGSGTGVRSGGPGEGTKVRSGRTAAA